ncbi:glutamine synthetase family protein [Streptomyces sp. NPDC006285]|uniref:glutamine synthetase family protein n=1 Tax=Streptomyces sp. NPDC006285 TaxID=3364742 RepID=UPI0036B242D6
MSAANPKKQIGLLTLNDFHKAVAESRITLVAPALVDMWGCLKGKYLAADTFVDQIARGAAGEACAYLLASDVTMAPLNTYDLTGWDQGFQDIGLRPDLETIRLMPHTPNLALVHCDAIDSNGKPLSVDPRQMLRRQLDLLKTYDDYDAHIGLEHEFLLSSDGRPLTPGNADYALNHHPRLHDFFKKTEEALFIADTPIEAIKTEGAPGQIEVTFPYGPAMRACDNFTVYQQTMQHLAAEFGWNINVMAAPQTGTGSGLHLHLSLWQDGEPAFSDVGGKRLPPPLEHAIGGLLACMPELAPLWAPFPNSYKRYRPHSFAPLFMNWGDDNRGCAVRMVGHGRGRHLELRMAGADANSYLVATAACASIRYGLLHKIKPSPPCTGDAYSDLGSTPIHRDLSEALRHFTTAGGFPIDALGSDVVNHYAAAAQHELDVHRELVTDVERERGGNHA